MSELTKQLAEALRQLAAAHEIGVLLSRVGLLPAKEALAAYDAAQQAGEQALPLLPIEWRKVADADGVEVPVFRALQMRDYARAALSQPAPEAANPFAPLRVVVERDGGHELAVTGRYEVDGRDTVFIATPPAPEAQQGEPQQPAQAVPLSVPHPGSPEASAMIDSELALRGWPANHKNAARAGYEACRKLAGLSVKLAGGGEGT